MPQLRGVAAWLAAQDRELPNLIASSDPEILLDTAHLLSHEDRSTLVGALLQTHDRFEAFPRWRADPAYSRLAHPGLAEQLRPWVKGDRGNRLARLAAIDIAGACGVEKLQDELLVLVENDGEEYDLRIHALQGLCRLPNVISTDRLHDLALGQADNNPDDRLRGLALLYLWPGHLETAEVFRSVTPPRRTDPGSWYRRFVRNELVARLPDGELATAMSGYADLLAQQPRSGRYDSWFSDIAKGLWERVLKLDVSLDLVKAGARMLIAGARTNLLHPERLFRGKECTDTFRHALVRAIVASDGHSDLAVQGILLDLIRAEDLSWLLEELRHAGPDRKKTWAELASWTWVRMGRSMEGFEQLYPVAETEPVLRDRLKSWMDGILLTSEEARRLRESWQRQREWRERTEQASRQSWTCERVREVAEHLLDLSVSGDPRGWWTLVRLLEGARATDMRGREEDPPPFARWKLETYPAFVCLDDPLRVRLPEAARRYLREGDPGTDEPDSWWSRTDRFDWRAAAAVAALGWLRDHALAIFDRLPAEVWERWAPAIVEHGDHEAEPETALADVCYRLAPDALLFALRERLELRLSHGETEYALLRLAKRLEDDRVLEFLAGQLRAEGLSPRAAFEIARMLAERRADSCERALEQAGESDVGG